MTDLILQDRILYGFNEKGQCIVIDTWHGGMNGKFSKKPNKTLFSFYEIAIWYDHEEIIKKEYPYQAIGIMLDLVGIVFVALGFFYSPRKPSPTPSPQEPQPATQA